MIALIQRVTRACVTVEGETIGKIGPGLLALVCAEPEDTEQTVQKMAKKLLGYRVFSDEAGKMNLSVSQAQGEILMVSQFTLAAKTDKGMRPSFSTSAEPQKAKALFDLLVANVQAGPCHVEQGRFGAHMQIELVNDGPVTFWLKA